MLITLIGYRGTGKSSVAPLLAQRLGWSWTDADVELEAVAGRSIREIFATSGEPEFRRLERSILTKLLQREKLVLAAGGGAILNPDTRYDMRQAGPVVWLQASVGTIAQRITQDATSSQRRPTLTGQSITAEIESVLQQRDAFYRETATIIVATDHRAIADIVQEILSRLPAEYASSLPSNSGAPL